MVKRALVSTLLWAMASYTCAQQSQEEPAKDAPQRASEQSQDVGYIPYGNLGSLSKEDLDRAKATGAAVARDLLQAYDQKKTPEMEQFALQQKRRVDDLADATMAEDRKKALEFLGIDPEADTALYYFVSWSMPLELLRSYAIEAMWSGGTLVFKGVPPGKELSKFLLEDLKSLVYGKGASANISIDPRLFDAYEVKTVPSIVFTTVRANMQCQGVNPVKFTYQSQELSYDSCPPVDSTRYMKVAGAVTTSYALQAFIDDGLVSAKPYLTALSRGFAEGKTPEKMQTAFSGKWDDVLGPEAQAAARAAAQSVMAPTTATPTK